MKRISAIVFCLIFIFLFTGCLSNNNVATVNGKEISKETLDSRIAELEKNLKAQGIDPESKEGRETLESARKVQIERLVNEELVRADAEKNKLLPTAKEVDKQVQKTIQGFGSEKAFKDYLSQRNITLEQFKEQVKNQLIMQKVFDEATKGLTVSDKEVEQYYNTHKTEFYEPERIKLRHILIKTEKRSDDKALKEAKEIITLLGQGSDFTGLALKRSEDEATKNLGGQFYSPEGQDYITRGNIDVELEKIAFKMKSGEIYATPVKSSLGYHVLKLEDKKDGRLKPFKEVKAQLKQQLLNQKKQKAFQEYQDKLRKNAKIDY